MSSTLSSFCPSDPSFTMSGLRPGDYRSSQVTVPAISNRRFLENICSSGAVSKEVATQLEVFDLGSDEESMFDVSLFCSENSNVSRSQAVQVMEEMRCASVSAKCLWHLVGRFPELRRQTIVLAEPLLHCESGPFIIVFSAKFEIVPVCYADGRPRLFPPGTQFMGRALRFPSGSVG